MLDTFRVSITDKSPLSDQEVTPLKDQMFLKNAKARQRLELFCRGMMLQVIIHIRLGDYATMRGQLHMGDYAWVTMRGQLHVGDYTRVTMLGQLCLDVYTWSTTSG